MLTLILVLLAFGGVTAAAASLYMASSILRPPRMTDGKALYLLKRLAPDDIGLPYEKLNAIVRDEHAGRNLSLAAWWIPCSRETADAGRCAVLIHGYADAKVGALAWAPLWRNLGYNLLIPDLRAHGESGGAFTTAGYFERHDMLQLINQVRAERPDSTRQLVLFGASMGAMVAAATADLMSPGEVAAVVLESPIADMTHAIGAHADRLGMPGEPICGVAISLAQAISGARYADLRTADLIARLPCPVMVICPPDDIYLVPGDADEIRSVIETRAASGGADQYWQTENAEHLTAIVRDPVEYRARVGEFLGSRTP